jgi:Flp pilus assembly pilin Flp
VRKVDEFCTREGGQALIEYAVILALILVLVMGIVQATGEKAKHVFSDAANALQQRSEHD